MLAVGGAGAASACSPSDGHGGGHGGQGSSWTGPGAGGGWPGAASPGSGGGGHQVGYTPAPPAAGPCAVTASSVKGGTATFTVGPKGCTGVVGPISFSTYTLPNGHVQPFAEQVLFAHAAGNGASYGAGTYTLTAPLPDCSWQADLYWGVNQGYAPHQHPLSGLNVGWDISERGTCTTPGSTPGRPSPSTPTPPAESPAPSAPPAPAPEVTPTPAPVPAAPPAEQPAAVVETPAGEAPASVVVPVVHRSGTLSEALVAPGAAQVKSQEAAAGGTKAAAQGAALASTGFSAGPLLVVGLILVSAGGALVIVRRRRVRQHI